MSETRSAFQPRPVYVAASYMSRVGKYNGAHLEALTFVDLAEQVGRFNSLGVVIDVSALDVMDSFTTRTLGAIAQTTRLRGAETVIVGIQPDVAFAMMQLGLALDDVATALDLEEGVELLAARKRGSGDGGP